MNFVKYTQLHQDIVEWSSRLPAFKAVAGIPRSGMMAANLLGLHRNIPTVSVYDLLPQNSRGLEAQLTIRRGGRPEIDGDILVLDDSCNTGGTLREWRSILTQIGWPESEMTYASVYVETPRVEGLDIYCKEISWPRRYEWNVFHSRSAKLGLFDMDGVLCEDHDTFEYGDEPDVGEPHHDKWLEHMDNVKPLHIPTVPILAVVTSRLEKYRPQAESWLERHGVQYEKLFMSKYRTAAERRKAAAHGHDKGLVYRDSFRKTQLFYESDKKQAQQIANIARKPVLWVKGMEIIKSNEK